MYDAASGARVADLPVGGMRNQVVAWHPHGERLAVAGSDPRIQIWNVAARRQVATLEGHVQYVPALTFHPDGKLLASHGWDGQLLLWDPSSGRQLLRLTSVIAPRFSADGRWLGVAWHGGWADLLEVTPSREYRTLVSSAGAGRGAYNSGDVSPDGRLLAVGMDDGARLWDLGVGREVAVLPEGTNQVAFEGRRELTDAPGRPRALLTGGSHGLLRWPVTGDPESKGLRLGQPRQISPGVRAWFARSPDGRTLGAVTEQGRPIGSWIWKRGRCGGSWAPIRRWERSRRSAGMAGGRRAAAGLRTRSGSGTSARVGWSTNGSSGTERGSSSPPTAAPWSSPGTTR